MTDIFSKEKRSEVMSAVRYRNSRIEAEVKSLFRKMKIRYRSHPEGLVGKPDFYLPDFDVVVFVDSCFWHGCRHHGTMPKSKRKFWMQKIRRNRERDREVNMFYKKQGKLTLRIWEHSLKTSKVGDVIKKSLQSTK